MFWSQFFTYCDYTCAFKMIRHLIKYDSCCDFCHFYQVIYFCGRRLKSNWSSSISQADPSFRDAVIGMRPMKEKHQMYTDIHAKFGLPLAFQSKFQLNAIIRRDTDIPMMSQFPEQLVLPFLWAEDGFTEPSDEMTEVISNTRITNTSKCAPCSWF